MMIYIVKADKHKKESLRGLLTLNQKILQVNRVKFNQTMDTIIIPMSIKFENVSDDPNLLIG